MVGQWLLFCLPALALFMHQFNSIARAQGVGVNYGLLGDNLLTPDKVIGHLKSRNIQKVRLFDPNPDVLKALEGSGIEVILGTRNEDLQNLGSDPNIAAAWVATNVVPHATKLCFRYISAGNEVIPGDLAVHVLPTMQNLEAALKSVNLSMIPISTTVATQVLGVSFPPSQGAFSASTSSVMAPIAAFLEARKYPLLVNVYPYFAYAGDPKNIRSDYALFGAMDAVVTDGTLVYNNLFDAMVDSMYSALEKVGGPTVEIVVTESGWPSAGNGDVATVGNAQTYNNNLIAHVLRAGTPKRHDKGIETYLFAIFNEDLKPAGAEQNFGLYYPNMTEVYRVNFTP